MPRTKKAPGQAIDGRNGRRAELEAGVQLEYFPCPVRRALRDTRDAWELAWVDPVHKMWTPADGPILVRWSEHYDRALKSARRADRKPVVLGSVGQPAEHPSYATMGRSVAIVEKCEAQLGFGALNRNRLGLTMAAAQKSLLDLNEAFLEGADDEPDPRL